MRCSKVKRILGAYIDGELSERKAKQVQRHLERCFACTWELKSFQRIDELGRWVSRAKSSHLPEGYWDIHLAGLHRKLEGVNQKSDIAGFFGRCWRYLLAFAVYWIRKMAPILAAAAVIAVLVAGMDHMRHILLQIATMKGSEKSSINFYLKEHESAVIQATYPGQSPRREIELGYEDVFYYNAVRRPYRGWLEETGLFLRAPRLSKGVLQYAPAMRGGPSRATDIANGRNLSLQKAQKAVSFKIVTPQTLHPGYFLETIRKIEGKGCLQMIYTNGISTLSLFEQAVESEDKFHSDDFKEYVIYSKGGIEPVNIIGWNSAEVSFTLIGEEGFSYLMRVIRALQESYLEESGLGNTEKVIG